MEQQTYSVCRLVGTAVADLAAKPLMVLLLAGAVFWPDLSELKGKASTARLVVYPLGASAMPVWWWLGGRLRRVRYRWAADLLITLPWLIDLLGDRINLFDTVGWGADRFRRPDGRAPTAGGGGVGNRRHCRDRLGAR